MCLRIKVAELNTLSDGKGITVIHLCSFVMRWNQKEEMQIYLNYLSENANLRKLADVKEALLSGTSQQALSVSLESLLTSDIHT